MTQGGITSTSSGVLYYVDTNQEIHQLYWGGNQWYDANVMSSSQSGYHVAPGSGVTVNANGILYYVDTGGDVHQTYWGGSQFLDADLMSSSQSGYKAQAGTGTSVDANGNVYYVSTGQTVHQMWWGGTKMLDADLMASSGSGVQVESATEVTLDSNATIYYVATDDTVHKMYWGGSNFQDTNFMAASSQPYSRAEAGTGIAVDSSLNVYYVDPAQTIHQMAWNGSQFQDSNLMTSSQTGLMVSLGTEPWIDSSGYVYYVDTAQTVHKMYWGGSQWLDQNLMSSSGAGYLVEGDSEAAVDGNGNVYYVATDQTIHQMIWNGSQFQDINLMSSSGSGALAAASYTISGQVTSNGSGLAGVAITLTGTRNFVTSTDAGGDYSFAVPASGNYTLAASLAGYSFTPASQALNNVYSNQGVAFMVPAAASPTVTILNLTHPDFSPNFEVGDTFQATISGAPNQPVYQSQVWNGNSTTVQLGTTNAAGILQWTGSETTSQTGTYTEVYTVGGVQASPSISYVVAAGNQNLFIASETIGETQDGHLTGVSYLSIGDGFVDTYSATELDYVASSYYGAQTVATLYEESQMTQQGTSADPSNAIGGFISSADPWRDFTLQTDHYVVALFYVGGDGYSNPFYYGDGECDDASSDCSVGGGTGPVWVEEAAIYVGSTLADQTAIPTTGNFLGQGIPSGVQNTIGMTVQFALLTSIASKVIRESLGIGQFSDPPIPLFVQLLAGTSGDVYVQDCGVAGCAKRQRTYVVKDSYGRPWNQTYPVLVQERFEQIAGTTLPPADGSWASASLSSTYRGELTETFKMGSTMADFYGFISGFFPPYYVQYNQYYFSSNFQLPTWWNFPPSQTSTWPLGIIDSSNNCLHGPAANQIPVGVPALLAGQTILLTTTGVGVDGDTGPPSSNHNGCGNPFLP